MHNKETHYTGSARTTIHKAKKQIREAVAFDKCRIMEHNRTDYAWDDIYGQEVIIVLSNSTESYYLFDYYYIKLCKYNIKINAVIQATEDYCCRRIRNFRVLNIKELSELQKKFLFIVFDIDHYQYIFKLMKKYQIKNICNIFALEEQICNALIRTVWEKRYSKKLYAEVISEHLYKKEYCRTEVSWKNFKKECRTKHLVIFGAGKASKQFLACYFHCIEIEAAIDNAVSQWGGMINGIKIYSPDYLYRYKPEEVIILVTPLKCQNILEQLSLMGYTNYYVFSEMEGKKFKYQLIKPFYYVEKILEKYIPVLLFYLFDCFPVNKKRLYF